MLPPVDLHTNTLSPLFPQRTSMTWMVTWAVSEHPYSLVAVTVKVYLTLLVSPVTVAVRDEPPTVAVIPPGDEVTV